jgi:VWFA-related protein
MLSFELTNRASIFYCVLIVVLIAVVLTENIWCQDEPLLKLETTLVNVPVFVSDKRGDPIKGLSKDKFKLSFDGREQKVDFFDSSGPATIAILIDSNSNTTEVMDRIKRDAQQLVDLLGPEDRAMVVSFDVKYKVICDLTSNKNELKKAIARIDNHELRIRAMGLFLTRVRYAELGQAKGRRAVVVFADPDSDVPGYVHPAGLESQERESAGSDVAIYPVFYQTSTFPQQFVGKTISYGQLIKIPRVDNFYSYAAMTGGRFVVGGMGSLSIAFSQIIDELHSQYVLGVYVDNETNVKNHAVSVQVDISDVSVRTKPKVIPLSGRFKANLEKYVFEESKKFIAQ